MPRNDHRGKGLLGNLMPLAKYTRLDLDLDTAMDLLATLGSINGGDCTTHDCTTLTVDTGSNISIVHPEVLRHSAGDSHNH